MARDTRDRMLAATALLLHRQGYHATGLNQILAESGAPKGSMYFHFPGGKEQLVAEAVVAAGAWLDHHLASHEPAATLDALDAHLDDVATALAESDYAVGCPIATVALEVAPHSAAVGDACAEALDRLIDRIASWLERDGAGAAAAAATAQLVYVAIEGALVLAKARRSTAPLTALRGQLPGLVGLATEGPVASPGAGDGAGLAELAGRTS
jgi:TetR/AcrR family transcriptional repressor of lmrAB and yxaGH operons